MSKLQFAIVYPLIQISIYISRASCRVRRSFVRRLGAIETSRMIGMSRINSFYALQVFCHTALRECFFEKKMYRLSAVVSYDT